MTPGGGDGACAALERAVRAYCALVETAPPPAGPELAGRLADALLDLLEAAVASARAPAAPHADVDEMWPGVRHAEWHAVFRRVGGALPVTHHTPAGEDPETGGLADLGDDVADVWRDLRGFLSGLDRGAPLPAACREWCDAMHIHWGEHAREALPVLIGLAGGAGAAARMARLARLPP